MPERRDHDWKDFVEDWLDSMDPFRAIHDTAGWVVFGLAAFGVLGSAALWWRFGAEIFADVQKCVQF